jgi:Predicted pyridoxal phosphate-dependent enzyme apparently involved in regulation of cell wall biogenesis
MSDHLPFARPTIDEKSIEDVAQVLRSGWIASGPYVAKFESALSTFLGGREVRTVTSGTAALEIALRAAGVREGDGVIVPAMSFAASANVVMRVGAIPVFVDVELRSRNLDLALVPAAISPRVRAIMPVHFAGLPVDQERLYDIAAKHGVRVIEDAAHAIGSTYRGRRIGSFGDVACFSFHPNKNLTTIEGGAIAFGSGVDVDLIELERFHGIIRDGEGNVDVVRAGGKYNLSDVAARLGLAQLERLDGFTARRRELANLYFDELGIDPPGVLPERGDSGHCWNMFTLLLPFDQLGMTRAQFQHAMGQRGIGVGVHYPCIPSLTAYRNLSDRSAHRYPNAARIGRETVTLPLFPTMADSDVRRVCEALRAVLAHRT